MIALDGLFFVSVCVFLLYERSVSMHHYVAMPVLARCGAKDRAQLCLAADAMLVFARRGRRYSHALHSLSDVCQSYARVCTVTIAAVFKIVNRPLS